MEFRIIIPVHNPPADFLGVLDMLERDEKLTAKTIVVDDGSTNGISGQIREAFPDVCILQGDGSLWWAGGMHRGMLAALEAGADVILWLNHDCAPDSGTIRGLVDEASRPGVGAVSAWCRTLGHVDWPVNPGFVDFKPIPRMLLEAGDRVEVDGVNGNCVAINAQAVRSVGLPDTKAHPHYGDGPYTWRLHCAGFRNFVTPRYRATLERDLERCIDERDHSMVWRAGLLHKLRYYFCSPRSKYHWRNRFQDMLVFRGRLIGLLAYPAAQIVLGAKVALGHFAGRTTDVRSSIDRIVEKYSASYPPEGLRDALTRLSERNI